jgi:(S)-2-hydroxyglutarate dehydrogenase
LQDVIVAGGGIVGLATAHALLENRPGIDVAVLEKEPEIVRHQSGHNSGVIHSGAYYRPGSKKAQMCREGRRQLIAFCEKHALPYRICGKLIVATSPVEVNRLRVIAERAAQNGIADAVWLDAAAVRAKEPAVAGVAALEVPSAGIVDYKEVGRALAEQIAQRGGRVVTSCAIEGVGPPSDGPTVLATSQGTWTTRFLVNCAGLQSDRLARWCGVTPSAQIVPFRGEYFWLKPERAPPITRLIYPVPDPALPFLGVHLTLTLHGRIEAGPNAVLAFAREGYQRRAWSLADLGETLAYPGFWAMARQHWRTGVYENFRSLDRTQFAHDLARLVPALGPGDLGSTGSGVRAQAVGRDGRLLDDFLIERTPTSAHVLNAPSPAATSSFAIGQEIAAGVPRYPG